MKHTSGPWVSSSSTIVIAPNMGCHNLEEATANASLIAAAPDMYEALRLVNLELTSVSTGGKVRSAIAKAEGRV